MNLFQKIFIYYQKNSLTLFYISSLSVCCLITLSIGVYSLLKFGISLHHDEWVGRGLYPGLAFGHGLDLYEPKTGPHITMYGCGTALFYSPTALASTPTVAIWLGFILNLAGFLLPLNYLLIRILSPLVKNKLERVVCSVTGSLFILFIFAIEPTTEGILHLHADLPALFFLLIGFCFFEAYNRHKNKYLLFLVALSLVLSAWAKLPTLPTVVFPILYLLSEKRFKETILYFLMLIAALFSTLLVFSAAYGWNDISYILFEFVESSKWSVRDNLFNGENAELKDMNYFEAVPLLFRFLVMYIGQYWFFLLSALLCFTMSFRLEDTSKLVLRSASILYFLTLPSGLAALAHFGSIENSLLFVNGTGLLVLFISVILLMATCQKLPAFTLSLCGAAALFGLPVLRIATSLPDSTSESPHQQAFEYLKKGNDDIFFGWYPISHLLHSGKNYSCIEVPTWVGMNKPDAIDYSVSHFPNNAKYLATCHTGYGSFVLQQYLGELKEHSSPRELSSWRLFELTESFPK